MVDGYRIMAVLRPMSNFHQPNPKHTNNTMTAAIQDLPPAGGFPNTIRYQRYLPRRGPSGAVLLLAAFVAMGYGWTQVAQGNAERRLLRHEKQWSRVHLTPLLQAETDRDLVRRIKSVEKREKEIMGEEFQVGLKAPVKGLGKFGVIDAHQEEPVYYTKR